MGVVIGATVVLLNGLGPGIETAKDGVIIDRASDSLLEVDSLIGKVASESSGSRRTVSLNIPKGVLVVNGSRDSVSYSLETQAGVISPRSLVKSGNLREFLGSGVSAYPGNYSQNPVYILENSHLVLYINNTGSQSSPVPLRTRDLIVAVYQKDTGKWLDGRLDISLDSGSSSGVGYTVLHESAASLPYATVTAFINSSEQYYMNFTLGSDTDFVEIQGALA